MVALDPRSQGRSQKADDGHHLARRARDIAELIQHLGDTPLVLAGWSSGAIEVLTYVRDFGAGALRAVVLVDMFIGVDTEPPEPHPFTPLWSSWIAAMQHDRDTFAHEFVRAMFVNPHPDAYLDAHARATLATPTNSAIALLASLALTDPRDLRPALDALDRPVLYVVGPPFTHHADEVRRRRPDARVEILDGVGHALFADAPDRFNRILEAFLRTLPTRAGGPGEPEPAR